MTPDERIANLLAFNERRRAQTSSATLLKPYRDEPGWCSHYAATQRLGRPRGSLLDPTIRPIPSYPVVGRAPLHDDTPVVDKASKRRDRDNAAELARKIPAWDTSR